MKKRYVFLICLCCWLFLAALPAQADVSEVMLVTNCNEWVSLREYPDTNAARLEKVRLGELVTHCSYYNEQFIECVFNGKVGYIQTKYLKTTGFTSYETFPGNQMVVNVTEWASMYDAPDGATRIAKVPVGTIVTCCVRISSDYIYCEYKEGKKLHQGFISRSHLKNANYNVHKRSTSVKPFPGTTINDITMIVVNCDEWVSLREKASASAARLARVPLGTPVEECVQVSDTFVYCRYLGLYGYIQLQYLSESEHNEPPAPDDPGIEPSAPAETFSGLPALPDFMTMNMTGQPVMADSRQGYTIIARKAYNSYEEMLAVCYDSTLQPLWRLQAQSTAPVSEVVQLDAFAAGRADDPRLVWYISGIGFFGYKYGPAVQLVWFLPNDPSLKIDGSFIRQADKDGSFYLAFSDVLAHISADGQLLWRTSCNNTTLFQPAKIEIDDAGISVLYDNHFGIINVYDEARFTTNGTLLYITQRPIT